MHRGALVVLLAALPSAALAQNASSGCDKPGAALGREAAMMGAAHATGTGEVSRTSDAAVDVPLKPFASAQLPIPPERPPQADTNAGSFAVAAGAAGPYRVSVTEPAWVDVIQGGRYLMPTAVTAVEACAGLRKSLSVDLGAGPLVLQFSNVTADRLTVTVVAAP